MLRKSPSTTHRQFLTLVLSLAAFGLVGSNFASISLGASRLLPQEQLQRLGLVRAWMGQVNVDPARNQVERAVLTGDRLTVLTTTGVVQEFNALTGQSLWTAPIGNENFPSLGPACSDEHVAIVNGSTLYVLDRKDGRPIIIRRVGGAPGAAPAMSAKYVFVPLANGRIEGFPLTTDKMLTPWYYQSDGRTMVAPLATPQSIIWTTETGYLYVGKSIDPGMRFRLETGSEIVAPPAYKSPFVYVAATSGEVFSMHEITGIRQWKYATGFPVVRAPAPVGDRVFVTSEEPALHCIDAKSGTSAWQVPHVSQFAAASKRRVYGVDDQGSFVVLDQASGSIVGRVATDNATKALVNDQTDRIYLISASGVIECLREIDAKEPLYHNPKVEQPKPSEASAKQPTTKATAPAKPAAKPAPKPSANSKKQDAEPAPAEKADKPAKPAEKPAEKPTTDDNPFGT